jgi:hypothetical protein
MFSPWARVRYSTKAFLKSMRVECNLFPWCENFWIGFLHLALLSPPPQHAHPTADRDDEDDQGEATNDYPDDSRNGYLVAEVAVAVGSITLENGKRRRHNLIPMVKQTREANV